MLEKSIAIIHKKIQQLILPFTCIFCHSPSDRQQDLCQACLDDLPIVARKCPRCAQKLVGLEQDTLCGLCLQKLPPFAASYSLFAYEEPIARLILDLKFNQRLVYARIFGELMVTHIKKWYRHKPLPALLLPIPLHEQRLKERGYNQALEIARPIAKKLPLLLTTNYVQRVKNTPAQMSLSAEERSKNLRNAFFCSRDLSGKSIALIDDVMTTGSTCAELSRTLLAQGATRVDVWCCARR